MDWTRDGDVIFALRRYISGKSYHSLCGTCKALRALSFANPNLCVKRCPDWRCIPRGASTMTLSSSSLMKCLLPDTLAHIEFGPGFNFPVHRHQKGNTVSFWQLPSRLEHLSLGPHFNMPVLIKSRDGKVWSWSLPATLKSLSLGQSFHQTIVMPSVDGVIFWRLPDGLRHLNFGDAFQSDVLMNGQYWKLPSSLRTLRLGMRFHQSVVWGVTQWRLPDSLHTLILGSYLGDLHNRIWSVESGFWSLPPKLKVLHLGSPSINKVMFSDEKGVLHWWRIPDSVEHLSFGDAFTGVVYLDSHKFWLPMPKNIKTLNLGSLFTQHIVGWDLPKGLQTLIAPASPLHGVTTWNVAQSVQKLRLGGRTLKQNGVWKAIIVE